MTEPRDDETRPLPPASGEPQARPAPTDSTAPLPPAEPGAPAWTSAGAEAASPTQPDAAASAEAVAPHAHVPAAADPALSGVAPRRRWSGRRTAVVAAAVLGVGALGAAGAAAAVGIAAATGHDESVVRQDDLGDGGAGRLPGGGEAPDDTGAPGAGRGGHPGGPPPGGLDHDGDRPSFGDRDGDADGGLPGPDTDTGTDDSGDANGTDAALDT